MFPVSRFPSRPRISSFLRDDRQKGMGPLTLVPLMERSLSSVRLPNEEGMEPEIPSSPMIQSSFR